MLSHIGDWFDWPYSTDHSGSVDLELKQEQSLYFFSQNNHHNGDHWEGGGNFSSKRKFVRYSPSSTFTINPFGKKMYVGRVIADAPASPVLSGSADLRLLGPEAYHSVNPDKSLMDLGNSLFELKDLPSMVKQGFHTLRNARDTKGRNLAPSSLKDVSNFNLAVAFGWLPLLSDCISLYQTQRKMASTVAQLKRDNGRPVRRSRELKNHSSKSEMTLDSGIDNYGTMLDPKFLTYSYGDGSWELSHHETVRVWINGRFRQWLPDKGNLSDNEWDTVIKRRLWGLNPTPSRIYKAMPWSWLIDWFGNIGDNLANLNTNVAERQINDYCYLMRHQETFNRLTVSQTFKDGFGRDQRVTAVTEAGTVFKERVIPSPFGFGVKLQDLSPFQATILGSLGGSRMRA